MVTTQTHLLQLDKPEHMLGIIHIITNIFMSKVCDDTLEEDLRNTIHTLKDNGWQPGIEEAYGKMDEKRKEKFASLIRKQ